MKRIIETFESVRTGLNRELLLLDGVAKGSGPAFMIWSAERRALTLPERYARNPGFAAASAAAETAGWPVETRRTGGGITPQGPGVLNVAIAFSVPPKDARSVPASYAAICDPLITALKKMTITAQAGAVKNSFCDGDYNLEVGGRKLVGTAQRWRGSSVLCHALVLVDLDLAAAVTAAQLLADHLQLGDTYRIEAHTVLSEHSAGGNVGPRFAQNVTDVLVDAGFTMV